MTVTIANPPALTPFGPGFPFGATSDFVGPLPTGAFWEISLRGDVEDPTGSWSWNYLVTSKSVSGHLGRQLDGSWVTPTPLPDVADGQPIYVRFRLMQDSSTALDSATVAVEADYRTGLPWMLDTGLAGQAPAGLTPEQAAQLTAIEEHTIAQMGVPGSVMQIPLSGLLVHPPLGLTRIDAVAICRTGDGFLAGDSGLLPSIYGLWWEFSGVPPGVGSVSGATTIYEMRIVQLQTVHTINGLDVVTELIEANWDRVVWLWAEAKPTRIEYSILPGVTVCFHYVRPFVP